MSHKIECLGCGNLVDWDEDKETVCPYCGEVVENLKDRIKTNEIDRLKIASDYRRVGRFDDSQQELEGILSKDSKLNEALFGCFLNAYEVTEYAFDKDNSVKTCKCMSASRRPVEKHSDWLKIKEENLAKGLQLKQWTELSKKIEEERRLNLRVKQSIPKYRAILTCDYTNEKDATVTEGLYDILSEQTDVFFAPRSLENIPREDWDRYLAQILKNPEIAPLMFVIYSDAFNYRNKSKQYFSNIAEQCREFAKTHTMTELFSVTCDYEPSPIMKRISVKTIRCADFDEESYDNIANAIMNNIASGSYDDDEYDKYYDGEIVMIDEHLGLSPIIEPLDEE
ncbi:MAG: hypothetical protein K2M64_02935 [Clostridia bacterium]|nr:hypothetical protein [Clostridia bacterium]